MGETQDTGQRAVAELVAHYQGKARGVARAGIAVGAVVGALVGTVPLSPLRFVWPIPPTFGFATVLVGLGVGLLFGYVIGDNRARMYYRMAEQARLQLQLEQRLAQNDARIAKLVSALAARVSPAPAPAAPAPVAPAAPVAAAPPPVLTRVPEPAAQSAPGRAAEPPLLPPAAPAQPHPQPAVASGGGGMLPPLSPPTSG